MNSSFITWYPYCRRSDTIAAALGGRSHLIHYLGFRKPLHAPLKYVLQFFATLRVLRQESPDVVFVAVPPVFAALPVLLFAKFRGVKVVVDAHTGIFDHARWRFLLPLTRYVFRKAASVVVTNEHLANLVRSWGGRPVVIGTVPVRFVEGIAPTPCQGERVVVVNSFAVDEPLAELLEAARGLPELRFFVTGNPELARRGLLASKPTNVEFTGFISEEGYAGLLRAADVVVVLTTHDHTMQRGAYEAVALEKPLVTSDWGLLRETFSRGTIHVLNEPDSIRQGIEEALRRSSVLVTEMQSLRVEREKEFDERLKGLITVLAGRETGAGQAGEHAPTAS